MAIDSDLYFKQQGVDVLGGVERGLRLSDMIQQRQQQRLASEKEKALQSAYVVDESGNLNREATLANLGKIDPRIAMQTKQQFMTEDVQNRKNAVEGQLQKFNLLSRIAPTMKDQASYTAGLQALQNAGIDVSQEPRAFDPNYVARAQSMALSAQEQIANRFKEQELGLKREELYQKKTNKETGATAGQLAVDRDFAKDYNDWTSSGRSVVDKNLDRLESAKEAIKAQAASIISYPTSGRFAGRIPDIFTPEQNIRIRQDVQAAAQGALKATLGAQFTEKEGERIMRMAYDEKLSPEENIKKIDSAIAELKTNKANQDAKADYFEQKGTLTGFKNQSVVKTEKPRPTPEQAAAILQQRQKAKASTQNTGGNGG